MKGHKQTAYFLHTRGGDVLPAAVGRELGLRPTARKGKHSGGLRGKKPRNKRR